MNLYGSKESSVHNTAGVAIRTVVSSLFERLDCLVQEEGVGGTMSQLPSQANDAYLLFQVLINTYSTHVLHVHWFITLYIYMVHVTL